MTWFSEPAPLLARKVTWVDFTTGRAVIGKAIWSCPAGTLIEAGIEATAGFELVRKMVIPPSGAIAPSLTVPLNLTPPATEDELTVNAVIWLVMHELNLLENSLEIK